MSKIPSKFLDAVRDEQMAVRYRWGETFQGKTEWTSWDKGLLVYEEKTNSNDEPGVNILDEGGWGFAGREKDLEEIFGHIIFGRYSDGPNEHLIQIEMIE